MCDIDITIIKCSNPEVIKACALATVGFRNLWGHIHWQDGDTELTIKDAGSDPNNTISGAIEGISRRFPDDVITCRYTYEVCGGSNPYASDEISIVEYLNGERKKADIEPWYVIRLIRLNNEKDSEGIYNKARVFFRKLDKTGTDKDGNLFIDWFPEKVCYEFEYDSEDGKKYKAEATKCREKIDFKVYEGLTKFVWEEARDKYEGYR